MTVVNRRRTAGFVVIVLAISTSIVALMTSSARAQEAVCPAPPEGAIVVNLPFEELYSNRGPGVSIGSPVSVDIPAGNYDVVFTTWDDHITEDGFKPTQTREVLQLEGFQGGSLVFTSGETPDLPDDVNLITATVASGVDLSGLDSLRAVHADPGADRTANSLHPLCVFFVPNEEPPPPTTMPETTTTEPETTTTEPETTTTEPETTTTEPEGETTTTTEPEAETTTTATVEEETTTTVGETESTLPFTGVDSEGMALIALGALASGAGLVFLTRRSEESLDADA